MKIRIGDKDVMVLDRGQQEPRYAIIVNDKNYDLVDDDGYITDIGKRISAKVMDDEAVKAGATIIQASTCVDGGDIERYSDDRVSIFNANDMYMFIAEDLGKDLVQEGLAKEVFNWG